jgi:hypothetical protein
MTAANASLAEAVAELATEFTTLIERERSTAGNGERDAELRAFAQLLRPLTLGSVPEARCDRDPSRRLPVCRYLADALAVGGDAASPLIAPLQRLAPLFIWTQNPNYRRNPPSASFLDNYGYAVIAGPEHGAPALLHHPDLAFGLLLLGPHTTYPAHQHPASEIYVPLGPAEWLRGEEPFTEREAASVIHHPPNLAHATRSGALPLAALYLWAGDLSTYARLVDDEADPMAAARGKV